MKNIKVLGTGCAKCEATVALIENVAEALKVEIKIYKVEDPAQIMAYGVMSTPAVIIDKKLLHKGSVPAREEVEQWLKNG
ncbi:MAG TPA: thioredoxin family protein [Psychromonas sp.]